jgi:hypothetical protein
MTEKEVKYIKLAAYILVGIVIILGFWMLFERIDKVLVFIIGGVIGYALNSISGLKATNNPIRG